MIITDNYCRLDCYIVYLLPNHTEYGYVGVTSNPYNRMSNHKHNGRDTTDWMILSIKKTKEEALELERLLHTGFGGSNKRVGGTSTLPGVSWNTNKQKWVAVINLDNKTRWLGQFDTEEEAYNSVKDARIGIFPALRIRGTSETKGVSFIKAANKWKAVLNANGQRKYLGQFKTEEEAVEVIKREQERSAK